MSAGNMCKSLLAGVLVLAAGGAWAQSPVTLLEKGNPSAGWVFDNGREFPGATGKLAADPGDAACLRLDGDFSKGGNYVEAKRDFGGLDPMELRLRLKYPGADHLTIRIGDAGGQCHQISLKLKPLADWQEVRFPLAEFLAKKGNTPAAESVARYENWGGANDARWHGPGQYLSITIGPGADRQQPVALTLRDVTVVPAAPVSSLTARVRLDAFPDDELDWNFINGQEFPGASGKLELAKDGFDKGRSALRIQGDFTKGGLYVAADKSLGELKFSSLHFSAMSTNLTRFGVRLIDSTGQCHQRNGYTLPADGQWHPFTLQPADFSGIEHWGGANDGKWHAPATLISVTVAPGASKTPTLALADIYADVEVDATVQAASFCASFEDAALPAAWRTQGNVTLSKADPYKGPQSLAFQRDQADMDHQATSLRCDPFPVRPGTWEIAAALKSSLYSPDSSYNGRVTLDVCDAAGKTLDSIELAVITGATPWKVFKKRVDLVPEAATARFSVAMNKSYGTFSVDELTAAYVAPAARAAACVTRIKFDSKVLGNLFYPTNAVRFDVVVECNQPLPPALQQAQCVLRDYWGAELSSPITVKLDRVAKTGHGGRAYSGTLDLSGEKIEAGKYYEVHASVTEPNLADPSHDMSAFAVLPEAVTKQYKPFEIPFTSRDWDNRIKEYFFLSDRLGIRVCGIWSGWSAKPPYAPSAPGIEWCKQLGMGALLGAPNWQDGTNEFSEIALREGARNMVNAYKDQLPILVTLGNEPHPANDARAREMIASYKAVYEGVKAADSNVLCIGTSCGADDIFFRNGFQPYLDVYDFHVYEDPAAVVGSFAAYEKLFAKYPHSAKPIWSTETGLNSQGMTRHAITIDLVKKFALFFASGGQNMSWFDLLYPDPEGKRPGSNSESFDVFDSRFCLYRPKLDAVAYYNMVNGIAIKKFVASRDYAGGLRTFLFRDQAGHGLLVSWNEKERQDVMLPLEGVGKVKVIRIDGASSELEAHGRGLTLSVGAEPLLLLFDASKLKLAPNLGKPQIEVDSAIEAVVKGGATRLTFACDGVSPNEVVLTAPPFWTVKREQTTGHTAAFTLTAPRVTAAREGRVSARLQDGSGELSLAVPISDRLAVRFVPTPFRDGAAGLAFSIRNNSDDLQDVAWKISLAQEMPMEKGTFQLGNPKPFDPAFRGPAEGTLSVAGHSEKGAAVAISNLNPLNLYNAKLELTAQGKTLTSERACGGFVGVPKASHGVTFDGQMGDPAWQTAPAQNLDDARQYFMISGKPSKWNGAADLSGKLRFLWDDQYLYLGMQVTDDVFCNPMQDGGIWNGDGLQLLIDPCRESTEKPGKYEYALALGQKGAQAWCNYSSDPGAPLGEARDIRFKATRSGLQGNIVYEIAIPWKRLAPCTPVAGRDLGMCVIINEDDGKGRDSFMGWFGCAHSKQLGMNGDLILVDGTK